MNNRLRDLARQSHLDVYGLGTDRAKWEATVEKIASLIIQECVEINKQELAFNAFERLLNKYYDHFGVGVNDASNFDAPVAWTRTDVDSPIIHEEMMQRHPELRQYFPVPLYYGPQE